MPLTFTPETLRAQLGRQVAVTAWMPVTQERIDRFAEATGDDQWIHVDAERAAASPFASTIAHGFLTLSLLSALARSAVAIEGAAMAINYGLNRVRFITPVPAGARIRARFVPTAVDDVVGGVHITWTATIDLEGREKPACVAEWIVRYLHA